MLQARDGIDYKQLKKSFENKHKCHFLKREGLIKSTVLYSHDKRFIIKIISTSEMSNFIRIQNEYYREIRERSDSFLPKIYGVYQINIPFQATVNFMLMANIIQPLIPGNL